MMHYCFEKANRKRFVLIQESHLMVRKTLLITSAFVTLVTIGVISACFLSGFSTAPSLLIGFLSGGLTLSGAQIYAAHNKNTEMRQAMDELQSQFVYLHERQGQAEGKILEMAKRSIDSPSLALHATATDIDVLGSLVRDLAKTVAEHDEIIKQQEPVIAQAPQVQQQTSTGLFAAGHSSAAMPQKFESDAILGFTADVPPQTREQASTDIQELRAPVIQTEQASPAVLAELRETLLNAIANNRLELSLQPIVVLPQRKARGYEASMSLRNSNDKTEQNAPDVRRIAEATGLEVELDKALLQRATHVSRVLRSRNRDIAMCCTVSMASLADRDFRKILDDLARNDDKLARSILLEINDGDLKANIDGRANLFAISQLGIGVGIILTNSLRFHAPDLVALGVRQMRVPAHLMLSAAQGAVEADIHPADVAELLQRNGIDLLVSDISDEDTVRDMLDYAAQFAQGNLFGTPRIVRPEVLEPKSITPATEPSTRTNAAPQSGAERTAAGANAAPRNLQRQSFRSLLRRA
jgi:cyclic-di-GMP phosphodiesterase, flagellum assembly factor TipF